MNTLLTVITVVIMALSNIFVLPVGVVFVHVNHVSEYGKLRPLENARVYFFYQENGTTRDEMVSTGIDGMAYLKVPVGSYWGWSADPTWGYVDYDQCHLLSDNGGQGRFTYVGERVDRYVAFSGICDAHGEM
jgi:hypothetical protein